jgi:hypothetical protein
MAVVSSWFESAAALGSCPLNMPLEHASVEGTTVQVFTWLIILIEALGRRINHEAQI